MTNAAVIARKLVLKAVFSVCLVCTLPNVQAQSSDTLIILDLFEQFERRPVYRNSGTVVYFNATDSLVLRATRKSNTFRFSGFYAFIWGEHTMRIEGVRIIKPADSLLTLRIWSAKTRRGNVFVNDTVLTIGPDLNRPAIFWNLLLQQRGPMTLTPSCCKTLVLTNHPFYMRNLLRRRIPSTDIAKSIRYQYRYENGQFFPTAVDAPPQSDRTPLKAWQLAAYGAFAGFIILALTVPL